VRDGVSVIACNFPLRVPAVPLQSDARERALESRGLRYPAVAGLASPLDLSALVGTETDGWQTAAGIVSDTANALPEDGDWPAGRVVRPNRRSTASLDRDPSGMESTHPSSRSAVI
jgi:hypothetical protein